MTELVVIFAVCAWSLLVVGALARGIWRSSSVNHELQRLLGAVQRACSDFLWQESQRLVLVLMAIGAALAGSSALSASVEAPSSSIVSNVVALLLGAMAASVVAHASLWSASRATASALAALPGDVEGPALSAFRGAGLTALFADAASLFVTLVVLVGHHAVAVWSGRGALTEVLLDASRSLPAAALGASAAAIVFQLGGGSFHTAAAVAAAAARERDPRIEKDEEQNPALVAELVGDYVGAGVTSASDGLTVLLCCNAAIAYLSSHVARSNAELGAGVLGLFSLPLVVRATGLLATTLSVAALRFDAQSVLSRVFAGGAVAHAAVLMAGLLGASHWLLGDGLFPAFFGAGALGIVAAGISGAWLFAASERARRAEGARAPAPVARALGLGLQHAGPPLLLVGACLGGACLLGGRAPLREGMAYALALAISAMLGTTSFAACQSSFAAIAEPLCRVASLRRGRFDGEARARAELIEGAAVTVGHWGQTQGILASAGAALLVALTLPATHGSGSSAASAALLHPIILLGGALGAISLLGHVGGVLKSVSRAAGVLDEDLSQRQQHRLESEPDGVLPSYRVSVQLAGRAATEGMLPLALTALLTPFAVASVLRMIYGSSGSPLIARVLMALVGIAALIGSCTALVAQGSLMALSPARALASRAQGAAPASKNPAGEFMGHCIGPAAALGLKAIAISALASGATLVLNQISN